MRVLVFLFILFTFFFQVPFVSAQEATTFKDAFLQLNLRVEDYNKAYTEYELRRSQYLRFKSLQSEQDARIATAAMLRSRDDVVIAYITTLKLRLLETPGITSQEKDTFGVRLDGELGFWKDHKANVPSAGTLADLVADSDIAEVRYEENQDLFYNTLFIISNGRLTDMRTRLLENYGGIRTKVEAIRAETRPEFMFEEEKLLAIDRFLFESENKIARAQEKQIEANTLVARRGFTAQEYSTRLTILGQSQSYLREVTSFLKEVLVQVKNK